MGVKDQDAASPSASETLDVAEVQTEATVDSSTAETSVTEEPDFLSVARSVVEEPEDAEGDEPAVEAGEGESPEAEASQAEDEESDGTEQESAPDDEDDSELPFGKHPRFKKLLAQRDEFRAGHEQFKQIQTFMSENGLTSQEAAEGFEVMALLKRDPAEAWNRLKPIVQNLLVATGSVLPDDLKQRVQRNEITREAAMEISRLRAGQQTTVQQQEFERQRAAQAAERQRVETARAEATRWEMAVRAKDPDFDAKYELIEGQILRLQRLQGQPADAAAVKRQLDEAYAAANKLVTSSQPRRPERKPVTGGRVSGTPRAEPQTMEEVLRRAIEGPAG